MTKYYVGYTQGNNEYVYVASVDNSNIRVSTTLEGALSFDDMTLAESLLDIAKTIVANQDYVVLKITTDIEEVA